MARSALPAARPSAIASSALKPSATTAKAMMMITDTSP